MRSQYYYLLFKFTTKAGYLTSTNLELNSPNLLKKPALAVLDYYFSIKKSNPLIP
ncbi:hypothetical protein SPHINGO8BC_90338 [Sphingobacterium multivorum]|uniref:Uncharacterized protein n=1 Tax=Sphingobacterium multivorum TaxID=28454 RepID=A0A654DRW2_SPHMU|nr:hypothetical protein SPHINGO8BC_90338 [Sphingobacterium multivorum]